MAFHKGKSGNPNGRPTGIKNKATADLRQQINLLLEEQFGQVQTDLLNLEPKDRVNAWLRLLEFAVPKLQRSETVIDLSKMTDAEIDTLLERALNQNGTHV